jgi:Tol biopolymer transport system component
VTSRPQIGRLAPILSLVGFAVVLAGTVQIYRAWTPALAGGGTTAATATPTVEPSLATPVYTNSTTTVPGTLVYVRDGNLWVQSGMSVRRITVSKDGSSVSGPTWSPDGQWIYYVDTRITKSRWYDPNNGNVITDFTLTYPVLCRIHADGSGQEDLLSGLLKQGGLRTFYWIRQPAVSPDGSTMAVISDGPTLPGVSDNLLHFLPLSTMKLGPALQVPENSPLGLSEPAFSPDGTRLAYVVEGRSGKYGAPGIWIYDIASGTTHPLATGMRGPSWSPDGRYVAATKVAKDKLDVVVLNALTGDQVAQVTSDGVSWGAVWSPADDALIYMHLHAGDVDLRMTQIEGAGMGMTFRLEADLTQVAGLDGSSRAAWYIPGAGGPNPTPQPSQAG